MRGTKMTLDTTVEIVLEECYSCGVIFGMTAATKRYYLDNAKKESFYCPNGHNQWYTGESREQAEKRLANLEKTLKAETERARWWKDQAETAQGSLTATKGHLTRMKKRVAGGVCPVCNRQFTNLHKHMEGQHPRFAEDDPAP